MLPLDVSFSFVALLTAPQLARWTHKTKELYRPIAKSPVDSQILAWTELKASNSGNWPSRLDMNLKADDGLTTACSAGE